jgi:hypothetical protein
VVGAVFVAAVGLIAGYQTRVASAVALLAVILLDERLPELNDGGDNITRLVLTYMLFTIPYGAKKSNYSLPVWIHNIAVLAIALQLLILYSTAGLMKLHGDKWHHGTAIYYISQVEWFSLPSIRPFFKNPLIATCATYAPALYLTFFAMAIISPLKLVWISFGIIFHLGIAVMMGLIPFSTVMTGMLLFLISDAEYSRMQLLAIRTRDRFRQRLYNGVARVTPGRTRSAQLDSGKE